MKGKYIIISDPYASNKTHLRRVLGVDSEWVKRKDDGGFIRIPRCHVWIETDSKKNENDSIAKYGPLTAM